MVKLTKEDIEGKEISCRIMRNGEHRTECGVFIEDTIFVVEDWGWEVYNNRNNPNTEKYKSGWSVDMRDLSDIKILNNKTTKGDTMKHAVIIKNSAILFETEEEARIYLESDLEVGCTGYLATNILKLEAVKKFKTTNMVKKPVVKKTKSEKPL